MYNADKSITSTKPAHDPFAHSARAHRINKLCRYGEGDICVKERAANLSEARLQVSFADATLPTEPLQRGAKATS
jgi:hypothetical protein